MKPLFRTVNVAAVFALASMLISGCSGGSSGGSGTTRAQAEFSNAVSTNANLSDFSVSGVADIDDDYGIHVGDTGSQFHVFAERDSPEYRGFYLYLDVSNPTSLNAGDIFYFNSSNVELYYDDEDGEWVAVSGRARVTSISGSYVTVQLEDVIFQADDFGATGSFEVDGSITYNENNIVDETNVINANSTDKHPAKRRPDTQNN